MQFVPSTAAELVVSGSAEHNQHILTPTSKGRELDRLEQKNKSSSKWSLGDQQYNAFNVAAMRRKHTTE